MKLFLCFTLLSMLGVSASVFPQSMSLNLDVNDKTVKEVFRDIESQSQYRFLYNDDFAGLNHTVTMNTSEMALNEVLHKLLLEANLTYRELENDLIVITPLLSAYENFLNEQDISVTGTVTDADDGSPLTGASIVLQGTTIGTTTDLDGNYTISAPEDAVLVFSFVGFVTQEVPVDGRNVININMESEIGVLDELVVVGYRTTTRDRLTTAVSSLTTVDEELSRPMSHVQDMLQGNIPGVTVIRQGGDPARTSELVIRGRGTLGASSPLWVVDGVPYYGESVNPQDIVSIDILKDAAAAAVYGAQAQDGVILVTTRRGETERPRFEVDVMRGYQTATNLPEALNAEEYQRMQTEAHLAGGETPPAGHNPAQNPWGAVTRTNWMDEVFRTAPFDNVNMRVSGQTDALNYASSFTYHNEQGTLRATGYERISGRLRTEYNLNDRFRLGQNFYLSRTDYWGPNTTSDYSGILTSAIYMNPAAPVYDPETTFHGTVPWELSHFGGAYGDVYNPVSLLERPTRDRNNLNLNANIYGEIDIIDGLTFRSSFNTTVRENRTKTFSPMRPEIGRITMINSLSQNYANHFYWLWDQQLNYNLEIGDHNIDLIGVYSADYKEYEYHGTNYRRFDIEEEYMHYAPNATEYDRPPSANAWQDVMLSTVGIANYSYDNRYFLAASIRRDASSRLPKEGRVDFFPSVSAAWNISHENFFNVDQIDMLKLRASWGEIGNIQSVGRYAFANSMRQVLSHLGEPPYRPMAFSIDEVPNPFLIWERSETYNVGLDLHMFRGAFTFTGEYYEKFTRGIILRNAPNTHSGMRLGPLINAGDVSNKGVEFSTNYRGRAGELRYNLGANFSYNNNTFESFGDYDDDMIRHGDHVRSALYPFRTVVGEPLRSYWLIQSDGLFQSQEEIDAHTGPDGTLIQPNAQPGDIRFIDAAGDGRIGEADKQFMGSATPTVNYGFNIDLRYGGFEFRTLLQGVSGNKLFWGWKYNALFAGMQPYNMDRRILDAWTPENRDTNIPPNSTRDPNMNYGTESDWYLYDASYLRIRNMTLGYTVPDQFLANLGATGTSIRLYLSVDNLYTFTDYPGIDPEIGDRIDVGFYPQPRTFTFGINFGL